MTCRSCQHSIQKVKAVVIQLVVPEKLLSEPLLAGCQSFGIGYWPARKIFTLTVKSVIFQLAASYAEGIFRNHAFVGGNKRTAFQTPHRLLTDNDYLFNQVKGHDHAEMMEKLGQCQINRKDAAEQHREHSRSLQQDQSHGKARSVGDI